MADANWHMLTQLLEAGAIPTALPSNLESVIAERLEEALATNGRADLDSIKDELAAFFAGLLGRSPSDAVQAIQGGAAASPAAVATFTLGQIAFAQHFAAQAADKRADNRFAPVFTDPKYAPYLRALAGSDYTGKELAAELNVREETVSRRLSELRELGVVDFRGDRTCKYNFLTPQARVAYEHLSEPETLPHRDPIKVRLMKARHQGVSEAFRVWPVLSTPSVLGH